MLEVAALVQLIQAWVGSQLSQILLDALLC